MRQPPQPVKLAPLLIDIAYQAKHLHRLTMRILFSRQFQLIPAKVFSTATQAELDGRDRLSLPQLALDFRDLSIGE